MKPCTPLYTVSRGDRPLELVYTKKTQLRSVKHKVDFDSNPPTIIPFHKDEQPAMISAQRISKIHTRKQSGPDLDSKFLPSAAVMST
jgi:hypothetical protein